MQQSGLRLMRGERFWLWIFLLPTLVGLLLGSLGPVIAAVGISFTEWDVITPPTFAGLENYRALIQDPTFAKALKNTAYYVFGLVPAATVLSLSLALLMNQKLRGITWYRTAYFLPVVSSTVAVALVWSWIYAKDFGLLNYFPARQPDTDRIRLWEVAGTAHVDRYMLGAIADTMQCGAPINDGPMHWATKAGLRYLDRWARGGEAPPEAPRFEVDESGAEPAYVRDENGIIKGGIRTPAVDVPVQIHSGTASPGGSVACLLMGSSLDVPAPTLDDWYTDEDTYLKKYEASTDDAVDTGFVLADDRDAMMADSRVERLKG